MNTETQFPNGFSNWQETHFEVVAHLANTSEVENSLSYNAMQEGGTGRLYETAEALTNEFEKLNAGREWDGEFFDEISDFLEQKEMTTSKTTIYQIEKEEPIQPKIMIVLEGGIIQHIATTSPDIRIVTIDHDDEAEEEVSIQEYKADSLYTIGHYFHTEIPVEDTDKTATKVHDFLKSINF